MLTFRTLQLLPTILYYYLCPLIELSISCLAVVTLTRPSRSHPSFDRRIHTSLERERVSKDRLKVPVPAGLPVPWNPLFSIFEGYHCHCLWTSSIVLLYTRITFFVLIPLSEIDPPFLRSLYFASQLHPLLFPFSPPTPSLPSLFWLEDLQPPTKTRKLSGCRPLSSPSSPPKPKFLLSFATNLPLPRPIH
jgi:hypothetical protein